MNFQEFWEYQLKEGEEVPQWMSPFDRETAKRIFEADMIATSLIRRKYMQRPPVFIKPQQEN